MTIKTRKRTAAERDAFTVGLSAVIVAMNGDEPMVLAIRGGHGQSGGDATPDALPSGPLESRHRTLSAGLRSWVEQQTRQSLGYVEQLYTFGDSNRLAINTDKPTRALSIGYLALVREARPESDINALWRDWYRYFPWEDRRGGKPAVLTRIERELRAWVAEADSREERRSREELVRSSFGLHDEPWSDERVLERYELLYHVGLVTEAHRDGMRTWAAAKEVLTEGETMVGDHRRMLATAIGRLRGKIKYRPVVFELMPPSFRFLQLQRAVEALAGLRLHTSNFRRLVESQGLVEETGEVAVGTGGRPARLLRFRREVLLERPTPGLRLPGVRVTAPRRR